MSELPPSSVPSQVLSRWSAFASATPLRFGTGLINRTFLVEADGKKAVLQRLHPIFAPAVNEDLDAVTRHLKKKGLTTPELVRADDGAACVTVNDIDGDGDDDTATWRMISFVDGHSVDRLTSPDQARAAGRLVAGFHAAVEDLGHTYLHVREGVHDTKRHLVKLARSMAKHRNHRLGKEAGSVGMEILDAGARLPDLTTLPRRHCHGDLKISNLLFDGAGVGVCLVDLDTLQKLSWPLEMGDALRSWCNPSGEDTDKAAVDVEIFHAAIEGYFSAPKKPFLMPEETGHLVDGLFTICVELSARFCADALEESYFGWNEQKYKTRGDHNLVRAKGQWTLAKSVREHRAILEQIVKDAAR